MKNKSKKQRILLIIIIVVFLSALFFYPIRSYFVMSIYSHQNDNESIMKNEGFKINIPGGLKTLQHDWYPYVITFNATDRFSTYIGKNIDMNVMYNFGAFDLFSSMFFEDTSDYLGAFYGAYVIDDKADIDGYGFSDDALNIEELMHVAKFDYTRLVLRDMGCTDPVFELNNYDIINDIDYLGYSGWVQINADITTNSPSHKYNGYKMGYIQYGRPMSNGKPDFYETNIKGRMYARYFEEYDATIVMYIMAQNESTIDDCDINILSYSKITDR